MGDREFLALNVDSLPSLETPSTDERGRKRKRGKSEFTSRPSTSKTNEFPSLPPNWGIPRLAVGSPVSYNVIVMIWPDGAETT